MKRFHPAWALFLLFLALFPLLPGCAAHPAPSESEGALFFFLGEDFSRFADGFSSVEVARVQYRFPLDTPQSVELTDPAVIRQLFDALANIRIAEQTDIRATDSEQSLHFICRDGREFLFSFEGKALLRKGEAYRLTNDESLWALCQMLRRQTVISNE